MSGVLIATGVVCLAIGLVTRMVIAETDKPATAERVPRSRGKPRHAAARGAGRRSAPPTRRPRGTARRPLTAAGRRPARASVPVVAGAAAVAGTGVDPVDVALDAAGDEVADAGGVFLASPAVGEPVERLRWWQRARSGSLLLVLLVVLGLGVAGVVGALAVVVVQLVRGAVG